MKELSEEAKELRNANQRKWRRNHPDKLREYNRRYWEKKAAAVPIEEKIMRLHYQGLSLREIARELEVSHMTVQRILKKIRP